LEGKPLSEVTWWHGNTQIDTSVSRYSVSGPPLVSNSKASLTITKVVRGDEGFYYCKAKNELKTDVSNAAYFTVQCELIPHYCSFVYLFVVSVLFVTILEREYLELKMASE